jgi:hypothetical protein
MNNEVFDVMLLQVKNSKFDWLPFVYALFSWGVIVFIPHKLYNLQNNPMNVIKSCFMILIFLLQAYHKILGF